MQNLALRLTRAMPSLDTSNSNNVLPIQSFYVDYTVYTLKPVTVIVEK